jgi:diguanylate cyclase (GGDEF)-like protein
MGEKDFLTGFLSKEVINPTLDRIKAECKIREIPFSVLVVDLDRFKTYNDKYGHIVGDDVLKYFSSTLRLSLREEEAFIFRFGGDEFIVVFAGKSASEARLIASDVMKNLKRRPFLSAGRIFKLSFSAGIASYPSDGNEIETILQKADKAMYFSKTHGRGKITLCSHMLRGTLKRALLIFIGVVIAAGALFYFKDSSYKDCIVDWLKKEMGKASTALAYRSTKTDDNDLDVIYLNSGRIIKGIIMSDNKDDIELNLGLEQGKGSISIRKSDIGKVRNRTKKAS